MQLQQQNAAATNINNGDNNGNDNSNNNDNDNDNNKDNNDNNNDEKEIAYNKNNKGDGDAYDNTKDCR